MTRRGPDSDLADLALTALHLQRLPHHVLELWLRILPPPLSEAVARAHRQWHASRERTSVRRERWWREREERW
eukprot:1598140-Rhodomonas_salina.2